MESAVKIPLYQRINMRLLVILLIALALPGWIAYTYFDAMISHGQSTTVDESGKEITKVNLKFMSDYPFNQSYGTINDIPQWVVALDGKEVELVGEIWAPDSASDQLDHFQLCYSIAKCCFSGPPQVQHFVNAVVPNNRTVEHYSSQVRVRGKLSVGIEKNPQGGIANIYRLTVSSVEPI